MAGAILHDIGKLREYDCRPEGAAFSAEGALIGHILLGRDIVREAAAEIRLDADTLLRLEHIIVAHQRLPEWGSPKPPMTPESLLVHYADDIDAKFEHDGRHFEKRRQSRTGHIEEKRADATCVSRGRVKCGEWRVSLAASQYVSSVRTTIDLLNFRFTRRLSCTLP